jgi:hypothetical protein
MSQLVRVNASTGDDGRNEVHFASFLHIAALEGWLAGAV